MAGLLHTAGDVGAAGAGTALNVIDLITAARSGQLGQALARRQSMVATPEGAQQANASPFLAALLGHYGSRQPTAIDAAPGGPSLGEQQMRFNAGIPTPPQPLAQQLLAGKVAEQPLQQELTQGRVNMLKQQNATQQFIQHQLGADEGATMPGSVAPDGSLVQPAGGAAPRRLGSGPAGMKRSFTFSPSGGIGMTLAPDEQKEVQYNAGTQKPGGGAYRTGDTSVSGKGVVVKPDAALERTRAAIDTQRNEHANDAKVVLESLPALREAAKKYLYTAPQSTPDAGIGGQLWNRAQNMVQGGYQAQVTMPNVLSSGDAPEFRTIVQKVIPMIRAAAGGTKGLRITQAEFNAEGKLFTHPEQFSQQDYLSFLDNVEEDMKRVASKQVSYEGDPGVGDTTTTPVSPTGPPSTIGGPAQPQPAAAQPSPSYDPAQLQQDLKLFQAPQPSRVGSAGRKPARRVARGR